MAEPAPPSPDRDNRAAIGPLEAGRLGDGVRVKICGITNLADAKKAVRLGADALGFVFAKSPRQVKPKDAAAIIRRLGPWITTVGVFVNAKPENVLSILEECRLSMAQLHGDETVGYARRLSCRVLKVFRVADASDLSETSGFPAEAYLFDTRSAGQYGGSGRTFDWELLRKKRFDRPFVLSGGLDPENVGQAVKTLRPYGVDVSSGVERSPGKKDAGLMKRFIQNAKKA